MLSRFTIFSKCRWCLTISFFAWIICAWSGDSKVCAQGKVVIPFDFISEYDDGVNGAKVAEMIWTKLGKTPGFVVPEAVQDIRDTLDINGIKLTKEATTEDYGRLVRETFDAQIGIWGTMGLAEGAKTDEYDLTIHCVDFSQTEPVIIYEVTTRTHAVSEIPHTYVAAMLDKMTGGSGEREDRSKLQYASGGEVEERWKTGENLLGEAGFDQLTQGVPDRWESVCGQLREPFGQLVRIEKVSVESFLRFEFPASVGDNEGCLYYSKPFAIEEGAVYRFRCRYRTSGPKVKVFIKCYDEVASEYASELETSGAKGAATSAKKETKSKADDSAARSSAAGRRPGSTGSKGVQYREVYRSQQNLTPEKDRVLDGGWYEHTEDFTPKHTKYTPRIGRVMLYAYIGAGTVDWDDVIVKKVIDAPSDAKTGPLRHSMESKVTIDDQDAADQKSRTEK